MEGIPGVLLLKCFGGVTVLYRRQSNQGSYDLTRYFQLLLPLLFYLAIFSRPFF